MTYRILVSAPYLQPHLDRFEAFFDEHGLKPVVPPVRERLEEDELLGLISDIDGIVCGDDRITSRVLDAAPRLKVICKWGTGVDSIDRKAAADRGIAVHNTPDAFTAPVSDSVIGYMLAFARGIPWATADMRTGRWEKRPGHSLHEKTLGIIGLGRIGQAVARKASVFGMTILGHDVLDDIDLTDAAPAAIERVDKVSLLRRADYVSLNCDLNPTSHHIIDRNALAVMRRDAVLINTARGPLVDEIALCDALQESRLGGAALDVFEEEPLPEGSPLRTFDNVLLAPHNANSSPKAWEHVHENTLRRLVETLETQRPEKLVP